MSRELIYFINGIYSAFDFNGRRTRMVTKTKSPRYYTKNVSVNTKENLRKSIGKVSSATREVVEAK